MQLVRDLDKMKNDSNEFKNWVQNLKQINEKFEELLGEKRNSWNKELNPLFDKLKHASPTDMIEVQSLALSYRQMIIDQISMYMNKLSKEMITYKQAQSDRFLFYSTGFGLKTNTGEKKILFDAELAELERNKELLETHIEFLRDCKSMCDNIGWAIKNKIAIMGILES